MDGTRIQFAVCFLLLCSLEICAQNPTATINGRVLDPTRAVIPGVTVEAVNNSTNIRQATQTNAEGLFSIVGLLPGDYRIEVSKSGFRTIVKPDVVLHVQDVVALNFDMTVGSVSETVTVEGGTSLINTESAAVSTVIDRTFVANIPLNGRSFQDLISITPGVVTQNPNSASTLGSGGDFSVNGQRTEANYYTVDGVSANGAAGSGSGSFIGQAAASGSIVAGTALGTTQSLVSVDALQEFRAQSSSYSAEYGRAPGGQFSLVTRSGTNHFHGTIFDYLRNDFFDANDWFNNHAGKPISALRQNDFGGTLGGPLQIPGLYSGKDKTFFFFSYEGLRLVQPQAASSSVLVPDTFMRQQAPPALQPILNAYPVPNGKDFGTAAAPKLAQFVQPFSLPSNIDSESVRLDHSLARSLSLFFRFGNTPTSAQKRGPTFSPSILTTTSFDTRTYTLGVVSQLPGTMNNQFHLGYLRSDSKQQGAVDDFGGARPTNLATAMGATASIGPLLEMIIAEPGVGTSILQDNTLSENRLRQWNLVDTFSFSAGHHNVKIGSDYRRVTSPGAQSSPFIIGIYLGGPSVLTNSSLALAVVNSLPATPIFSEYAAFVQDEWRVNSRVNVSLGLRWEVDPPPHGADGQDAYTLRGNVGNPGSLSLAPRGTPLWHTSWYNFAPRLGMVWGLRENPGWETVLRLGGGVFFDTDNQVAASGFSALGFSATGTYFGVPLPATPAELKVTPSIAAPLNGNVYVFPPHLQLPYTLQWNFGVQQAIGTKQALSLSYVGAAARRMIGQQSLSLAAFNPLFASSSRVGYWTSNLTSDYDALQVQFQRSVSAGLNALASYTWSHCIDVGSSYTSLSTAPGISQRAFARANCDIDARHSFQGGASWDLPSSSGNKILRTLASHWGLDGRVLVRTAFPVPLCGDQPTDPVTGSQYCAGLDLVPNQPTYLYGSQYPGGRAINSAAFSSPPANTVGSAPRNLVRGFGAWQINMAVRREFPLSERVRLQFRAEAFNVLNHPNFGFVDPNLSDSTFGQATGMLNQGLTTLASQYQQGGPRSMQFAVKVVF